MNNLSFGKGRYASSGTPFPIILRIMKIATVLMLVFMTCAYGSSNAQKVSLSLKNARLEDAFKEIGKQTKFKFLYNDALLKNAKRVNVQFENKLLSDALTQVLADNKLAFKIIDGTITINAKVENIQRLDVANEVQHRLRGTVRNAGGSPLVGASISIKGTTVGTTTDAQGNFSIQGANGATLLVKYIGYLPKEVPVGNQETIAITLLADNDEIEEVVVTGLGVKIDKRTFTGATSKVNMKDIELGGLPDPSRALEGRVAGVVVQNTTGTFGTAPKIRVRGATSIYGSSKPLWVVDGVIVEDVGSVSSDELSSGDALTLISSAVAGLNANDIESFTVLKDGSATSIYGARAMGGVIVITTKRGTAGRNSASYVGEFTTRAIPSYNNFNIMNSQEQMSFYQILEQRGWLTMADVASRSQSGVYGKMYELIKAGELENTQEARNAYLRQAEYRNTDWFGELFSKTVMQNHSVSLSSGTDKAQYYTSISGVFDDGWAKKSDVKRYTALFNASYNLYDNLKLELRSNGSYRDQRAPGTLGSTVDRVSMEVKRDFDINPYSYALNTSRTLDKNEFYARNYAPFNILHELENNYMDLNVADIKFQGELKWKPIKPLELGIMGATRYQQTSQQHYIKDQSNQALAYRWMPTTFIRNANPFLYKDRSDPYAIPQTVLPNGGIYDRTDNRMWTKDFRATAAYDNTFNLVHKLYLFAGGELNSVDRNNNWFRGWGLQYDLGEIPFIDYKLFKKSQEENSDYYSIDRRKNGSVMPARTRQIAFYGTANYTYDNRYTVNGTLRYEGTNRLGRTTSARWMPTWNVSGMWNVNEEKFFKELETPISNLALKASYSLTADRGPDFVTNSKIIIQSYNPWRPSTSDKESGLNISDLENSELTYEKKHELNIGASLGLFKNRIALDIDYYKRKNFDLIGIVNTQGLGGEIAKYGNVADMESNGVEFSLAATILKNETFSWVSSFIYTKAKNKITSLENNSRVSDLIAGNGFGLEGYPVRSLFSIPFVRLNGSGLPVFMNEDGKETITGVYFQNRDNINFLKYEGPTDPTDLGSFGNVFSYKNFKLNVFFTYSFGNVVRLDPAYKTGYSDLNAMPRELWDAWTIPGDENITNVPVVLDSRFIRNDSKYGYAYNAYNYSTETRAKGDFIRLKDISLAYELPKDIVRRAGMSNLGLRLNVINPWLVYADKRLNGQDPEFVNSGGVALPIARQYTLTLRMGF
ncbi:SusC/RagA family TonB-linked outer membrane protein [Sphingobacterium paucimobilis]|uniref:TonB-linked outer membrane protein n=1 Tax=Sphingobacterium paucimobilis HER1398 TaxID=1346330 RepID=U2I048_9SPHI|nr:SusC/RagA family TonB-linked outer membrane protein [Sphingobacterium paucimobilis]ERJ61167.1 TonB-linked outer membrane protein [Sphingobacterium paucimobilis HER1398]